MVCRDSRLIFHNGCSYQQYPRTHARRACRNVLYQQATPFGDKRQLDRGIPCNPSLPDAAILTFGGTVMTKREIEIKVRLNQKEAEHLNRQVEKCRLSREAYLRHLIAGVVPREAPPPEYFAFMRELHYVGNLLNQIAQKAHVLNVIDAKRYDEGSKQWEAFIREVTAAVILPAKRE